MLESQLLRADLLITTGGVSMGAFDVVKQALSELGTVEFIRVAMQPGKPQGFGHLGNRVPIFCLPGNPVSALVSFEVFVRPAIRKLLGKRNLQRATVQAAALERDREPGRACGSTAAGAAPRSRAAGTASRSSAGAGSHLIASMASSNCLVVIDEEVTEVVAGRDGHGHAAAAVEPLTSVTAHPGLAGRADRRPGAAAPAALRDARAWSEMRVRNEEWLRAVGAVLAVPVGRAQLAAARGRRCTRRCARPAAQRHDAAVHDRLRRPAGRAGQRLEHRPRRARSCTIGYWVDGAVAGRGITPTALALVDRPLLRRGQACTACEIDIRPENAASLRVVEKLGLRPRGLAASASSTSTARGVTTVVRDHRRGACRRRRCSRRLGLPPRRRRPDRAVVAPS